MHRLFLFLLCCCLFLAGMGQDQNLSPDAKENNFDLLKENVFVHTDKDFFLTGDIIWFKIYVINNHSHLLQDISKTAYVEIVNRENVPVLQSKVLLDSGMGTGFLVIDRSLESGRYMFRTYTNWMKNDLSTVFEKPIIFFNTEKELDTSLFKVERSVAVQTSDKIKPGLNHHLQISTDKKTYKQRSPINVKLEMDSDSTGYLSVAVYKLNQLTNPFRSQNISDYFSILPSGKTIASPLSNLPELQGMLVTAEVRNEKSGAPVPEIPVYMSALSKIPDFKAGITGKDGKVIFNLNKEFGQGQLLFKTDSTFQNGISFNIEKPFILFNSHVSNQPVIFSKSEVNDLEEMKECQTVNLNYIPEYLNGITYSVDSTPFFGQPYKTYLLDNYTRFTTMEEVLREYVQEVNVRIRNKTFALQVFNRQYFDLNKFMTLSSMMTDGNPLVLLDGVPVFNMNRIIGYDPLKVRKLDIVADRFHIGPKEWNGLLSFSTYQGNFEGFHLNPQDMVIDFDGWQPKTEFRSPDYDEVLNKNSRIPDFRQLLYWNGNVTLHHYQGNLSFYTNDLAGKFIVVVQGITQSGVPVFGTTVFEVTR